MIAAIADRCSLKDLKHAAETYKQEWDLSSKLSQEEQEIIAQRKPEQTQFYRKGKISILLSVCTNISSSAVR